MLNIGSALGSFDRHRDFEIAVLSVAEVALDQAATSHDCVTGVIDSLATTPGQIHVRVVMPVAQFGRAVVAGDWNNHLEIALLAASEVALNDAGRPQAAARRLCVQIGSYFVLR